MRRNDNNPIQENNPVRFGIENLLDDDTEYLESLEDLSYQEDEEEIEEYNDLHNCSNDLSDKGSVREAIEHEKFANQKRAQLEFSEILSNANPKAAQNYEKYQNYTQKYYDGMKNFKRLKYIIIFMIVIIVIQRIGNFFGEIISEFDDYSSTTPEYGYTDQTNIKQSGFETAKQNIQVKELLLQNEKMLLEIENNNPTSYNNVNIQAIFYGENNQVITIKNIYATNLFANGTNYYEVYSFPKSYTRVDFLVSKDYWNDEVEINEDDVTAYMVEKEDLYNLNVKNNTFEDIDSIEIMLLYYKDGEIVDFKNTRIYDLDEGDQEETNIYKSSYAEEYDSVRYFVNSINIY